MAEDRPPRLRLFDILDCIRQMELTIAGKDLASFQAEFALQRVVERCLEIISEASRHIDNDMKEQESAVEWRQIASFGNVLRHGYQMVDARILWNITVYDMPPLKAAVERLYASVKRPADPWPDATPK